MTTARRLGTGIACIALLAAGCIRSDLEEVERADTTDDASAVLERAEVGDSVTTAGGNTVTVHSVDDGTEADDSDLLLTSADVEICADEDGDGAPSDPLFFRAVVGEGYRRPSPTGRSPTLAAVEVEPGECVRGWVGFPIGQDETLEGIALLASTIVEWSLS